MALDDAKEQLSNLRASEISKEESPLLEPKKEIDNSVWGGDKYLKGTNLRNWARSDEAWKKTNLPEEERIKISSELFGKSGNFLDKKKAEKTLKGLEKEMAWVKTDAEKERIKREIKVAKGILGK
jgi:hypothetical protein